MTDNQYIVFLDLDGTITGMNSSHALFKTACSRKLIGLLGLLNVFYFFLLYKFHFITTQKLIESFGEKLKGTDADTFADVADEAVNRYLIGAISAGVIEEIAFHKSHNARFAILSSAVSEICKPVAAYLEIDYTLCTQMEADNGVLTGFPEDAYCFGEEKKRRLLEFCVEKGFDTESAFYYADSFSDLAAFKAVGNPVCVNPDRRLKKIAAENNWQTRTWDVFQY